MKSAQYTLECGGPACWGHTQVKILDFYGIYGFIGLSA